MGQTSTAANGYVRFLETSDGVSIHRCHPGNVRFLEASDGASIHRHIYIYIHHAIYIYTNMCIPRGSNDAQRTSECDTSIVHIRTTPYVCEHLRMFVHEHVIETKICKDIYIYMYIKDNIAINNSVWVFMIRRKRKSVLLKRHRSALSFPQNVVKITPPSSFFVFCSIFQILQLEP